MGKKNRVSIIFTNQELEIIKGRLDGNLNDSTGVFSRRIRPKLKEILAWNTPSMKKQLKKLLKQSRVTEKISLEVPREKKEMEFEEFKKKHGY
ncbi:hypothetical protein AYK26_01115 [Euryarchaeota archaeon SM23-78]|nr:MAG: hypothetical protein AYK26_01115 [Euryarchaeota archaeon SM23-78]MBW3001226.1 hypothetical protein [Candidatus Woesearchaeota archaeon]